jgi:hypothetical protein
VINPFNKASPIEDRKACLKTFPGKHFALLAVSVVKSDARAELKQNRRQDK